MTRGMQTNVAKALGYNAPVRGISETVACPCGYQLGPADFTTDGIGRLIQQCPRCRHIVPVSPTGEIRREIQANIAKEAVKEARRLELRAQGKKSHSPPKVPPRTCALVSCGKLFAPKNLQQKFCSKPCVGKMPRNWKRSLGLSTDVNSLKGE